MHKNLESHFEIKPGKHVFIPTKDCLSQGKEIVADLLKAWSPNKIFYHFGKRGGHVAAMRMHTNNSYFARIDLEHFFMNVTRTKIVRSLRSIGYDNCTAFDTAYSSVVKWNNKKFLPYGFPQSMALATLALEKSCLGKFLIQQNEKDSLYISIFVDDIIISSNDESQLKTTFNAINSYAQKSRFSINTEKSIEPSTNLSAFNCEITKGKMNINSDRLKQFKDDFLKGNHFTKQAIERYISAINEEQLDGFIASLF